MSLKSPASRLRRDALGMLLPAATALLYVAAIHPRGEGWLGFVALIPLLWLAEQQGRAGGGWRRSLASGLVFGLVANGVGFHWLPASIAFRYDLGGAAAFVSSLLMVGWLGARFAIFHVAVVRAERRGWRRVFVAAPLWVALEAFYPRVFPDVFAIALVDHPSLASLAELGGASLLSGWLVLVNALLLEVLLLSLLRLRAPADSRRRLLAMIGLVVAATAPLAFGELRGAELERTLSRSRRLRVAIVQPDKPMILERGDVETVYDRLVESSLRLARDESPDLLLWPESAPPEFVSPELSTLGELLGERLPPEGFGAELLFGAATMSSFTDGRELRASAFLADAGGRVLARHDKVELFPFGERMPLGFGWLADRLDVLPARAGEGSGVIELGAARVGVLICYEDLLAPRVREVASHGPGFLANLTNDAWFGEGPAAAYHLQLSRLRAIEHRLALVRAANHGVTAVIDPFGAVASEAPSFEPATLVAEVPLLGGTTIYQRVGDVFGWLALALTPLFLLRRRPRAISASPV